MSEQDLQQLQAYRSTGLTPDETNRAVRTFAGYMEGAMCYERIKNGVGCPGNSICPIALALLTAQAADPERGIIDGKRTATLCSDLALCYPDAFLRYFWADLDEKKREAAAK